MNLLMLVLTFLLIISQAFAEPAPKPTPLMEPGMDTKAPKTKKPPRPLPPIPPAPAGPTPFDPGNAPVVK